MYYLAIVFQYSPLEIGKSQNISVSIAGAPAEVKPGPSRIRIEIGNAKPICFVLAGGLTLTR
jgi:hypothetical protein